MQMVARQLVGDDLVIKDVAFCVMNILMYYGSRRARSRVRGGPASTWPAHGVDEFIHEYKRRACSE